MTTNPLESCGEKFNLDDYFKAQEKTKEIVLNFSQIIKPGMTETEAKALLEDMLDVSGALKKWHPTKLRMGINTTKSFREESAPYTLTDDDLFFIDIGPVYYNHEGDYGESFVIGENSKYKNLVEATKKVFESTKEAWKENKMTGSELYCFAEEEAKKYHLKLNTNMYGHRLGDFPHALYCKEKLGDQKFIPAPNLWVLEIHLIDQTLNRGAFFEDILF